MFGCPNQALWSHRPPLSLAPEKRRGWSFSRSQAWLSPQPRSPHHRCRSSASARRRPVSLASSSTSASAKLVRVHAPATRIPDKLDGCVVLTREIQVEVHAGRLEVHRSHGRELHTWPQASNTLNPVGFLGLLVFVMWIPFRLPPSSPMDASSWSTTKLLPAEAEPPPSSSTWCCCCCCGSGGGRLLMGVACWPTTETVPAASENGGGMAGCCMPACVARGIKGEILRLLGIQWCGGRGSSSVLCCVHGGGEWEEDEDEQMAMAVVPTVCWEGVRWIASAGVNLPVFRCGDCIKETQLTKQELNLAIFIFAHNQTHPLAPWEQAWAAQATFASQALWDQQTKQTLKVRSDSYNFV